MKEIKYTIHFGKKPFRVNEWLYNYFNKVKGKPRLYSNLYNIVTGLKRKNENNNISFASNPLSSYIFSGYYKSDDDLLRYNPH